MQTKILLLFAVLAACVYADRKFVFYVFNVRQNVSTLYCNKADFPNIEFLDSVTYRIYKDSDLLIESPGRYSAYGVFADMDGNRDGTYRCVMTHTNGTSWEQMFTIRRGVSNGEVTWAD